MVWGLSELPLVGAPMAGAPTTVALAEAVADAGAFPILAAGYKTADAVAQEVRALRATTSSFGVNLFVPGGHVIEEQSFRAYARELQSEADRYGLDLSGTPLVHDDDGWRDKLELLLAEPVPVVSFTFGLPRTADIRALQASGTDVLVTVTTVDEARAGNDAGVNGIVAQGSSAGGHSGTWDPARPITEMPTVDLVRAVRSVTTLPVLAAGGVAGTGDVRDLLAAGAGAVTIGTLLLRTDESGANPSYQQALAAGSETVVTRAFTGRPARGLRNGFIDRHEARAPVGYPEIHHLTRSIRQAAARTGDTDRMHLWAGTGFRSARPGPAADVIARLVSRL